MQVYIKPGRSLELWTTHFSFEIDLAFITEDMFYDDKGLFFSKGAIRF